MGDLIRSGVEMNWNLFNGGRTRTSIKKASVELNKAQAQLDAAIRRANVDVKVLYAGRY